MMTKKEILEILKKGECGISGGVITGYERILRIPEHDWQRIKQELPKG